MGTDINDMTTGMWLQLIGLCYVIGFGFGMALVLLLLKALNESGDRQEQAELHQMLHKAGWSRAVFVVLGGVFWPITFLTALKNVLGRK